MTTETITKKEAVKKAIDAGHATAKTGAPWIKEQFGLDVKAQQFSAYKGELAGTKGKGKKRGRKEQSGAVKNTSRFPEMGTNGHTKHSANGHAPINRSAISIDDISAVKALAQRVGVKNLHALIDLVGV